MESVFWGFLGTDDKNHEIEQENSQNPVGIEGDQLKNSI